MNKFILNLKKAVLFPVVIAYALGATMPANAFPITYEDLVKKIYALFWPILAQKRAQARSAVSPVASARAAKNTKVASRQAARTFVAVAQAVQAKSITAPVSAPVVPVVAQVKAAPVEPVFASVMGVDEAEVTKFLDALHAYVQNATACKSRFLDANVTRSYRAFREDFRSHIESLHTTILTPLHTQRSSGKALEKLYAVAKELDKTQHAMCNVLEGDYNSSITLGWALTGIKNPAKKSRDLIQAELNQMQSAAKTKPGLVKKIKILKTDVHALLTPPDEQGRSEWELLGLMGKRVV